MLLGELFREAGIISSEEESRNKVGWLEERKLWNIIEPRGRGWDTKDFRPFMILERAGSYVYFLLFSTSDKHFKCDKDKIYNLSPEDLIVDFGRCSLEEDYNCQQLKSKKSKVFKRMLNSSCAFVLRIGSSYLDNSSRICGRCPRDLLSEAMKAVVKREMEEWKAKSR